MSSPKLFPGCKFCAERLCVHHKSISLILEKICYLCSKPVQKVQKVSQKIKLKYFTNPSQKIIICNKCI